MKRASAARHGNRGHEVRRRADARPTSAQCPRHLTFSAARIHDINLAFTHLFVAIYIKFDLI